MKGQVKDQSSERYDDSEVSNPDDEYITPSGRRTGKTRREAFDRMVELYEELRRLPWSRRGGGFFSW